MKNKSAFEAAVPGMGLTAEPKGRPWLNPPQYATVEDAIAMYMPMFERTEFKVMLLEQLENGVPMTVISNIFVTSAVMEGKHTIDVGILIAPVLIEAMITIAENAEIDYVVGNESDRYEDEDDTLELVRRAIKNKNKKKGVEVEEPAEEAPADDEMTVVEEAMPSKGLMSPRGGM